MVTYLLLTTGMFFFGLSFIASKYALLLFDPVSIILFRAVIASLLLASWAKMRGVPLRLTRRELPVFMLLAFFQPFVYFMGETYGLRLVSASAASIIIATIPVFTPFASAPLVGERLTARAFFGLVLSFAGVALIVLADRGTPDFSLPGVLLMFLAVFGAVGYSIVVKKINLDRSPLVIVTWQHILGSLYLLPLFIAVDLPAMAGRPRAEAGGLAAPVISLVFLAVFSSTLAFIFYSNGIRKLGPGRANAFTNTIPLFTAVVSFFLLDERFPPVKLAGMAAVIIGVAVSQKTDGAVRSGSARSGGRRGTPPILR